MAKIKVILPASEVPDKSKVYKPAGKKWYRLLTELKIYATDSKVNVEYPEGSVFLHDEHGRINMIGGDEQLVLVFEDYLEAAKFFAEKAECDLVP